MHCRDWWALCSALGTGLLLPASAWAAESPWTWSATEALSHESNLFKLPDRVGPGPGLSRSDNLSTTTLDLSLEQPFGRQRLSGHAALEALRYRFHDELDHDAHHAGLRLDWETAGRLSGQLWASSSRSLRPLGPDALAGGGAGSSGARNLETSNEGAARVRLGGVGRLMLEAQLGTRSVSYSDPSFNSAELRTHSGAIGLRWRPSGASLLGAAWREARGDYVKGLGAEDRYRSRALDLWGQWSSGGAQRLYLRVSPTRARYELRPERNFSGLTGALSWQWAPRSPWRVTARAVRDLGQDAYLERFGPDGAQAQALPGGHVDDGVVLTRFTLAAERAVTAKVQAVVSASSTQRTLALSNAASGGAGSSSTTRSHDTTTQAAVGVRWALRRGTQLGCEAAAQRRQADAVLSTPYSARVYGCFGRLSW